QSPRRIFHGRRQTPQATKASQASRRMMRLFCLSRAAPRIEFAGMTSRNTEWKQERTGSRTADLSTNSRRLLVPLGTPQCRSAQYSCIFHFHRRSNHARRPSDVQVPEFVDVILWHQQSGGRSLQTHKPRNVTNECVAVVQNGMPQWRLVL